MKVDVCLMPSYESGLEGCYHAVVDTERITPIPADLLENCTIKWAAKKFDLFAGVARLRLRKKGGVACLWGDSEADDAEFTPVKGGEEKEYLVPVLLEKRDDGLYPYHAGIVIFVDPDNEHILEPYMGMLLPVTED